MDVLRELARDVSECLVTKFGCQDRRPVFPESSLQHKPARFG
jgi:hypothetical protein